MKRLSFLALSTLSALVLLFGYSTSTSGPLATSAATSIRTSYSSTSTSSGTTTSGGSGTGSTGSSTTGTGSTKTTTTTKTTTSTKVTGSVAQTQWGPVQVQLVVSGGRITSVNVLQYPSGNPKDEEINAYALPILTQETISAQNANIDMVSGATVTSTGYLQSLQSAVDQANL